MSAECFRCSSCGLGRASVRRSSPKYSDITGVGGTQTFDSLEIPQVIFGIGPAEVLLRPATITLQRVGLVGGECCVGNAGQDLLKAASFTIDFAAMTLRLNNAKH